MQRFCHTFSSDSPSGAIIALSATPSCVMPCEVCRLAAAAAVNELLDDDDQDDKGKARWQISAPAPSAFLSRSKPWSPSQVSYDCSHADLPMR